MDYLETVTIFLIKTYIALQNRKRVTPYSMYFANNEIFECKIGITNSTDQNSTFKNDN